MASEFQVLGNFFIITDKVTRDQIMRISRNLVSYNRDRDDVFWFTNNSPIISLDGVPEVNILGENTMNMSLPGSTESLKQTTFPFLDIEDKLTGLPFADADALETFLALNLGSLDPAVLPAPITGLQSFFLTAKGLFGTGGGWADNGFLNDVPVLFFDRTTNERQITSFYAFDRINLATNPLVTFLTYAVALPVLTTSDVVIWQLEAKYIGVGEDTSKAVDETLQLTQTLDQLAVNRRQTNLTFILDASLITLQDTIHLTFTRLASHVDDNYNSDIAVGQAGFTPELSTFNP